MPKVVTSDAAPNEPMYATVPIRVSARPTRFPRRFHRGEWVATSCMPSLSAPLQASESRWDVQNEDVSMDPPVDQATVKQEPSAEPNQIRVGLQSESIQAVEHSIKTEARDAEVHIAMEALSLGSQACSTIGNASQAPKLEAEEPALPIAQQNAGPRLNEVEERFRLEHAIETIDALNARIRNLQKAEQRMKKQLREEKERLKNSKAEAEGALSLLVMAEEKLSEAEGMMAFLKQDVDRYRHWWLTEYYSLKAMLAVLPQGSRRDFGHIVESAHVRFATFSARA